MPIFVEWQWQEHTKTFLTIFHFWDDGEKSNLRMRIEEEDFDTVANIYAEEAEGENFVPIELLPHYKRGYPRTKAYMSWAPSHSEFCILTELLTYANLINGVQLHQRRTLRIKLEGTVRRRKQNGREQLVFGLDSELLNSMPEGTMVSFAGQEGVSFEVRLEYIEYLRKILKPFLVK